MMIFIVNNCDDNNFSSDFYSSLLNSWNFFPWEWNRIAIRNFFLILLIKFFHQSFTNEYEDFMMEKRKREKKDLPEIIKRSRKKLNLWQMKRDTRLKVRDEDSVWLLWCPFFTRGKDLSSSFQHQLMMIIFSSPSSLYHVLSEPLSFLLSYHQDDGYDHLSNYLSSAIYSWIVTRINQSSPSN